MNDGTADAAQKVDATKWARSSQDPGTRPGPFGPGPNPYVYSMKASHSQHGSRTSRASLFPIASFFF